jgi:hypothetical protein
MMRSVIYLSESDGESKWNVGGTHFLNLEKPAEFNEAMRVFLTR